MSERGQLMNAIQTERPGAMAAIIGLDADTVQRFCEDAAERGIAQLANLNSPTQIVVSGEQARSTSWSSVRPPRGRSARCA